MINESSKGTRNRKKKQINNPSQDFGFLAGDFELAEKPRICLGRTPTLYNIA
jgi:hypothetical protein